MTARPAPDSRVDRLATRLAAELTDDTDWGHVYVSRAQERIALIESAGLLVLDPSSPELVERITDVLWMHVIFRDRNVGRDAARAVLAALSTAASDEL